MDVQRNLVEGVRTGDSRVARLASHVESIVYRGNWLVRLVRAMGVRQAVRTKQHAISLNGRSTPGRPPLRLAYASDFHAGPTTDSTVLRAACAKMRALTPDLLLLGGDFVTGHADDLGWLAHELGDVPAPLGRFAVLGNHDRWAGARPVVAQLEACGIQVLVNANVRLPKPHDDVWICGLDDHTTGWPDAESALRGAEGIRVILMHAPSGLLDLGDRRFDLALCGHTHGGQIALPGGRAVAVPAGQLSRRFTRGRFPIGQHATLIVSVGLGCVVLPIRTFAEPEIVLCTMQ